MIQSITSQGLVLYNRNFREDDKLAGWQTHVFCQTRWSV